MGVLDSNIFICRFLQQLGARRRAQRRQQRPRHSGLRFELSLPSNLLHNLLYRRPGVDRLYVYTLYQKSPFTRGLRVHLLITGVNFDREDDDEAGGLGVVQSPAISLVALLPNGKVDETTDQTTGKVVKRPAIEPTLYKVVINGLVGQGIEVPGRGRDALLLPAVGDRVQGGRYDVDARQRHLRPAPRQKEARQWRRRTLAALWRRRWQGWRHEPRQGRRQGRWLCAAAHVSLGRKGRRRGERR